MYKIFLFLSLLFVFHSCSTNNLENHRNWMQDNGKIKVLATTEMVADLVRDVGGSYVDTITLITGQLDPHSYTLVKGDDEKLARADLIFYSGLGLEHGPSLRAYLKNNPKALGFGDEIQKKYPELIFKDEGALDPHIWMDISLWQKSVPVIVAALQKQDPEHAAYYQERGELLEQKLTEAHKFVFDLLHQIPENRRYLVTSHDAFNYFTRAYLSTENETNFEDWKKRFMAPEGLAPEGQISAIDIQNIISHMKDVQVNVLFPESNVSRDSIKKILDAGRQEGLNLQISEDALFGDAMGDPSTESGNYIGMIKSDAAVIYKYLKEKDNEHK